MGVSHNDGQVFCQCKEGVVGAVDGWDRDTCFVEQVAREHTGQKFTTDWGPNIATLGNYEVTWFAGQTHTWKCPRCIPGYRSP